MSALLRQLATRLGFDRSTGAVCERIARRHLKQHGYRILAANLRNRVGEIDILAEAPQQRAIVIIEVKGRAVDDPATADPARRPEVHVNAAKQRKLVSLAAQITRRFKLGDRPLRFDIVGVDLPRTGNPVIRHHVNAFSAFV